MVYVYDISLSISNTLPVWPGDVPVQITQSAHLDRGDVATVSELHLSAHTGTHVDAPAHFVRGGASVDTLALDALLGPAWVAEVRDAPLLTVALLDALAIPAEAERVLFHTRNSALWAGEPRFHTDFVALDEAAAQWLVAHGVRLVGIDYLSVAPFTDAIPTHRVLLEADVVIVEGLDLRGIRQGWYEFICLPLKIAGCDGAPARALLMTR